MINYAIAFLSEIFADKNKMPAFAERSPPPSRGTAVNHV